MNASAMTESEQWRLEALERFEIDSDRDVAFDGLASLAVLVCGTPLAQITVAKVSHQWSGPFDPLTLAAQVAAIGG